MILGKVAEWITKLKMGEAVILTIDDLTNPAQYNLESALDMVRDSDRQVIVDEVNSEEYPNYGMWQRPDGRWTLDRR